MIIKKKNPKKVTLILNDKEFEMIRQMIDKERYNTVPALIHGIIVTYYLEKYLSSPVKNP